MKSKFVSKLLIGILAFLILGSAFFIKQMVFPQRVSSDNSVGDLSSVNLETLTIKAQGDVESENQAVLNFLAPGRVGEVNVKAGDKVTKGEVLASLDTTEAQQAESIAQANYNSALAALNSVLDNIHQFQYGNGGFSNVGSANETATQKAQRQEAESARDSAYQALQEAEYNLSLQTIVAPFNGVVSNVSNVSPGQNVTAVSPSSITVSGQGDLKFVANVSGSDVNSVQTGDQVTLNIDSLKNGTVSGTVSKIAQTQTTLSDGEVVFKVDVVDPELNNIAKIGQSGSALIQSSSEGQVYSVPSWLVLSGHYILALENGEPNLKKVEVGESDNGKTEIKSGLSPEDKLILDPEYSVSKNYKVI